MLYAMPPRRPRFVFDPEDPAAISPLLPALAPRPAVAAAQPLLRDILAPPTGTAPVTPSAGPLSEPTLVEGNPAVVAPRERATPFDVDAYAGPRPTLDGRRANRLRVAGGIAAALGLGSAIVTGSDGGVVGALARGFAGGAGRELDEMEQDHVSRSAAWLEAWREGREKEAEFEDKQRTRDQAASIADTAEEGRNRRSEATIGAADERLGRQLTYNRERDAVAASQAAVDDAMAQADDALKVGDVDGALGAYLRAGMPEAEARSIAEAGARMVNANLTLDQRRVAASEYQARVAAGGLALREREFRFRQSQPRGGSGGGSGTGDDTHARSRQQQDDYRALLGLEARLGADDPRVAQARALYARTWGGDVGGSLDAAKGTPMGETATPGVRRAALEQVRSLIPEVGIDGALDALDALVRGGALSQDDADLIESEL